jgi:hypothetical protein
MNALFYVRNAGSFPHLIIRGRGGKPFHFERKLVQIGGEKVYAHVYPVEGVEEFNRLAGLIYTGTTPRKIIPLIQTDTEGQEVTEKVPVVAPMIMPVEEAVAQPEPVVTQAVPPRTSDDGDHEETPAEYLERMKAEAAAGALVGAPEVSIDTPHNEPEPETIPESDPVTADPVQPKRRQRRRRSAAE